MALVHDVLAQAAHAKQHAPRCIDVRTLPAYLDSLQAAPSKCWNTAGVKMLRP